MKEIVIDHDSSADIHNLIEEERTWYTEAENYLKVEPDCLIISTNTRETYERMVGLPSTQGETEIAPLGKHFYKNKKHYVILKSDLFMTPKTKPLRQALYCHELAHSLYDVQLKKKYTDSISQANACFINDFFTEIKALECAQQLNFFDQYYEDLYLKIRVSSRYEFYTQPHSYVFPIKTANYSNKSLGYYTNKIIELVRLEVDSIASSYNFKMKNENERGWVPPKLIEYFDRIKETEPMTPEAVEKHEKYLLEFLFSEGATPDDVNHYRLMTKDQL